MKVAFLNNIVEPGIVGPGPDNRKKACPELPGVKTGHEHEIGDTEWLPVLLADVRRGVFNEIKPPAKKRRLFVLG